MQRPAGVRRIGVQKGSADAVKLGGAKGATMGVTNPPQRDERIAARLSRENKDVIEYAARLRGLSVSEFLVSSALDAARSVIEDEQVWRLTMQQSVRLMEMLNAEPRRVDALVEADERRRQLVAD
jgi:uncharacterized protein (DUF1778 family)